MGKERDWKYFVSVIFWPSIVCTICVYPIKTHAWSAFDSLEFQKVEQRIHGPDDRILEIDNHPSIPLLLLTFNNGEMQVRS